MLLRDAVLPVPDTETSVVFDDEVLNQSVWQRTVPQAGRHLSAVLRTFPRTCPVSDDAITVPPGCDGHAWHRQTLKGPALGVGKVCLVARSPRYSAGALWTQRSVSLDLATRARDLVSRL